MTNESDEVHKYLMEQFERPMARLEARKRGWVRRMFDICSTPPCLVESGHRDHHGECSIHGTPWYADGGEDDWKLIPETSDSDEFIHVMGYKRITSERGYEMIVLRSGHDEQANALEPA